MNDQEKYWDKVSGQKEFPVPFQIREFQKHVTKNSRVLDVGCGYGRTLAKLHQAGFQKLVGVDFSKGMVDRGRKLFPELRLEKTNGKNLPFQDGSFDAVILLSVLTCVTDDTAQQRLFSEIRRVLKDGGFLYISDYLLNQDNRNVERYEKYRRQYGSYGVFELPEGAVLRHHTKSHILKLIDGFRKLSFKPAVYTTMNGHKSNGFYLMAKKKNVAVDNISAPRGL